MAKKDQNGMTRTQKRKLKKEEKLRHRERQKRKQLIMKWSAISTGVLLLLAILYIVFIHQPDTAHAGILRVARPQYSFGIVHVRGGTVDTEIPLVNIGEGALTITALDSSCGCTTARIINQGKKGPIFGMAGHGRNPKDWRTTINPGEQATLRVYYNPAVHPDLRGPVTRIITIYSDDPVNPKQEVKIEVNQVG